MISQDLCVFMDCQVTKWTCAKINVPNLKAFQDIGEQDLDGITI